MQDESPHFILGPTIERALNQSQVLMARALAAAFLRIFDI